MVNLKKAQDNQYESNPMSNGLALTQKALRISIRALKINESVMQPNTTKYENSVPNEMRWNRYLSIRELHPPSSRLESKQNLATRTTCHREKRFSWLHVCGHATSCLMAGKEETRAWVNFRMKQERGKFQHHAEKLSKPESGSPRLLSMGLRSRPES